LQGLISPMTFESLKEYLEKVDIEGIVFHHKSDGRMCKLRKTDFGIRTFGQLGEMRWVIYIIYEYTTRF